MKPVNLTPQLSRVCQFAWGCGKLIKSRLRLCSLLLAFPLLGGRMQAAGCIPIQNLPSPMWLGLGKKNRTHHKNEIPIA